MRKVILFLYFVLTANYYLIAQSNEYDGIKVYPSAKNKTIFIEGEQIYYNEIIENTTNEPKKYKLNGVKGEFKCLSTGTIYFYEYDSKDTTHNFSPLSNSISPNYYLDSHHSSMGHIFAYGVRYNSYVKSLPRRIRYFPPGKYRVLNRYDLQPSGKSLEYTIEFEIIPMNEQQKKEYIAYIDAIHKSLMMDPYLPDDSSSIHSFLKKYPNSPFAEEMRHYMLNNFLWSSRVNNHKITDSTYWNNYYKDVVSNLLDAKNYSYRTKLAARIPSIAKVLKAKGGISSEEEYIDSILRRWDDDIQLSNFLITESERELALKNLTNYALIKKNTNNK